jgi:hypothetical protein
MSLKKFFQWSILVLAVFGIAACETATEPEVKIQKVGLGEADFVEVDIRMGAGELTLEAGSTDLMEGTFRYNIERWTPEVDYHVFNKQGKLSIRQKNRHSFHLGRADNTWNIRLNNRVPMDMAVNLGAGRSQLNLREFSIRRLDIDMGVGDLSLDISGERKEDLNARIEGGIGHGTIYLPENVGIIAEIKGGLGSIHAPGFHKNGHTYTSDAYGKTAVSIGLHIEAGIGSIELRLR